MIRTGRAEWLVALAAAAAALYVPLGPRVDDLARRQGGLAICIAPILVYYVLRSWIVAIATALACAILGGWPIVLGAMVLAVVARCAGVARLAGAMAAIETIDRAARGVAQCITYPPAAGPVCQLVLVVVGFGAATYLMLRRSNVSIYPFLVLPFSAIGAAALALVFRARVTSLLLLGLAIAGAMLVPQVASSIRARPFEPALVVVAVAAITGRFDRAWRRFIA